MSMETLKEMLLTIIIRFQKKYLGELIGIDITSVKKDNDELKKENEKLKKLLSQLKN